MNPIDSSHHAFIFARVYSHCVFAHRTIFRALFRMALCAILLLALCPGRVLAEDKSPPAPPTPPGNTDDGKSGGSGDGSSSGGDAAACHYNTGTYNVIVGGDFHGVGTASVSASAVQISVQIKDDAGNTGTLTATAAVVKGRFTGGGSVMGKSFKISGRVDAPDTGDKKSGVLRSSRLVATFFSAPKGPFGRIAGQPAS